LSAATIDLPPNVSIGWMPNSAAQAVYVACPVFEVLLWGGRGGGKTAALIADYAQHVGRGHGAAWRGIIFRRQARDLIDIVAKARQMLRPIFPDAEFVGGNEPAIRWKTGEVLLFRHVKDERDHELYQGHEYPFVGWEELTQWMTPNAYEALLGVCRSSVPSVPRKYRATCNPSGPGHNWVKKRFIDAGPEGAIVTDPESGRERTHIRVMLEDNPHLMEADPHYIASLRAISDPNRRKAWLEGSWDITSGGMFDDLWDARIHVVEPFRIPATWRIDRSLDWGDAHPFAVQWWAESDGTSPSRDRDSPDYAPLVPRGTLFMIAQWYGCTGKPNEGLRFPAAAVARGIIQREDDMGIRARVRMGVADDSIFSPDHNADSVGRAMRRAGCAWLPASKGKVSRINGWQMFRQRLAAALPRRLDDGSIDPHWIMEEPGIFIFDTCRDFIRTVPVLPRDEKNIDDVDTNSEDHDGDAMRYRIIQTRVDLSILPRGRYG